MKTFSEIIKINLPKISLLDVGAMKTGELDMGTMKTSESNRYESLFKSNLIEVIGFEANLSEYIRLKNKKNEKYLNYCLGDGTEKTLYVTNYPGCTSLYEPNPDIINLFTGMSTDAGNFTVIEKRKIKTHKLKDIKEVNKVDVVKIDTQGSELDILKNFEKKIKEVLIIESEVEFVELYKDQPLFFDMQNFLSKNGFVLHKLIDIGGRSFRPWTLNKNPLLPMSQLLWADAIFVRDFSKLDKFSDEDLLKISLFLHEIYNSYDLCYYFLREYDQRNKLKLSEIYRKHISSETKLNLKFMNLRLSVDYDKIKK